MSRKLIGIALAGACVVVCAAAPAVADTLGPGDPGVPSDAFQISFDAGGNGNVAACISQPGAPCTYTGATTGTAVTNVGGLGGNGFDFTLPQAVGGGIVDVLSGGVEVAALDFGPLGQTGTDLFYISSGASAYTSTLKVTANASGAFVFKAGPGYPSGNTYDGSLVATVTPIPAALPLFATGLSALVLLGWRRKRTARSIAA
jgi:hypothetical protein